MVRQVADAAIAVQKPGPFGPGFALRLARAEALAIGGSLRRENRQLILTLPALTASEPAANQRGGVPEHAV